jgi:hypothetical protein
VAVVIPTLFLIVVELALRLAGFGYSTRFFVKTDDGRAFTTNRKFGWQFMPRETATQPYPVSMPLEKPVGAHRIFILGESAAQGTPAPAFGFARILEMMWEVVYADGVLDPQEDMLLRRIAGLIYVSDGERGAARKRALERLAAAKGTDGGGA